MIYSVSYVTGPNDNGHCVSFTDYERAKAEFNRLCRDGVDSAILSRWRDSVAVCQYRRTFAVRLLELDRTEGGGHAI